MAYRVERGIYKFAETRRKLKTARGEKYPPRVFVWMALGARIDNRIVTNVGKSRAEGVVTGLAPLFTEETLSVAAIPIAVRMKKLRLPLATPRPSERKEKGCLQPCLAVIPNGRCRSADFFAALKIGPA